MIFCRDHLLAMGHTRPGLQLHNSTISNRDADTLQRRASMRNGYAQTFESKAQLAWMHVYVVRTGKHGHYEKVN